MAETPFYDSLDEYSTLDSSGSPEFNKYEEQTENSRSKQEEKEDENEENNFKKSDAAEAASIPLCSRQYNVAVLRNRLSRRGKRRPISKIPVLSRRCTTSAIPKLLSQQTTSKNSRITEWLQDVEIERSRKESTSEKDVSTADKLLCSMTNLTLDNQSFTGINSNPTMISLNSQSTCYHPKESHRSWAPPIRRSLSYLGQYRMRKLSKENNQIVHKQNDTENRKSIILENSANTMEKSEKVEKLDALPQIYNPIPQRNASVPNDSSYTSSYLTSTLSDGVSLALFPPSLVRNKPESNDPRAKGYVPYSVEDYRRLPVPRLGRLGPDLEACKEKLDLREKQRAYGERVSLLNRQKLILKDKRMRLMKNGRVEYYYPEDKKQYGMDMCNHIPRHSPPPPPPQTPLQQPLPPLETVLSPRDRVPRSHHVLAVAEEGDGARASRGAAPSRTGPPSAMVAAWAATTRRGRGGGRPGRPPPAPRRHVTTAQDTTHKLRLMLERHLKEREEEHAIRNQLATLPPLDAEVAATVADVASPRRSIPTRRNGIRTRRTARYRNDATARGLGTLGGGGGNCGGTRGRRKTRGAGRGGRRPSRRSPRPVRSPSPIVTTTLLPPTFTLSQPDPEDAFLPRSLPVTPPSAVARLEPDSEFEETFLMRASSPLLGLRRECDVDSTDTTTEEASEPARWAPLLPRPAPPPPPPSSNSVSFLETRTSSDTFNNSEDDSASDRRSEGSYSDYVSESGGSVSTQEPRPISSPPAFISSAR